MAAPSPADLDRNLINVEQVLALLESEGRLPLSPEATVPSEFAGEMLAFLPSEGAAGDSARKLTTALEALLTRQYVDSKLLVAVCVAIKDLTGLPMAKVLRHVEQARGRLALPSPSWVSKTMKAAKVVDAYPSLASITDVEKLAALDRLPEESLKEASERGVITVDGHEVDIRSASRKEVGAAIRAARGDSRRRGEGRDGDGDAGDRASKIQAALSGDDDRHELLTSADEGGVSQISTRRLEGASAADVGQDDVAARARAIDFFLQNFLTGDPETVLGLKLAAAEQVLTRLVSGLPDDAAFAALRSAAAVTLKELGDVRTDARMVLGQDESAEVEVFASR